MRVRTRRQLALGFSLALFAFVQAFAFGKAFFQDDPLVFKLVLCAVGFAAWDMQMGVLLHARPEADE